jgi:geranylgeranyl pyrophosphate synthase
MSVLASIRDAPGLDGYLDELEERLQESVRTNPGSVADVASDALAAGGKRLRPMLVFLSSRAGRPAPIAAGVAVELVHMATLIHDDLIDGAEFRRGRASAWAAYGPQAARAAGDYLFARAFSELAETGDEAAVRTLANATLCLARGEAMQRRQTHDPDTTVESYLERCSLKTGKLFEAACLLGCGCQDPALGQFGLTMGIVFQITDDILDCTGATLETGKVGGVDLREGTPTLPLLLAAKDDAVVRSALEGGPLDGALLRVAATGALDRSREVALEYAERARSCLDGQLHREELEALTYLVVDRES